MKISSTGCSLNAESVQESWLKKLTIVLNILSIGVSCSFLALFTLSTFSYISDFKYVPQYYNMSRNMALLSTVLYAILAIQFVCTFIKHARHLNWLAEYEKSSIELSSISVFVKICSNKELSPEEHLFSRLVVYTATCTLLGFLHVVLPAIVACALPSILSLDKNLMVASLSLISAVAVLTCVVKTYCAQKLLTFKLQDFTQSQWGHTPSTEDLLNGGVYSDSPIHKQSVLSNTVDQSFIGPYGDHISSTEKTLKDAFDNDNLLDNAYLVDTEVSQSVVSGKTAATLT